jgi:hypothetical protein
MARRANDPMLLQAQAQGGREGENAWRAARVQLANQRQQAVRQAMQEAALRGAPGAAIAQIQSRVAAPYNQGIRTMTQMGGIYGADMAARQGRMEDYNQAVLQARQLIPTQVQQAVAPIRAENRFRLQSIRQEGANRVAEIEAQAELMRAQMEAEAAERARREAAEAPTLNQSELYATLVGEATSSLGQAAGAAEQIAMSTAAQAREGPRMAYASADYAARKAKEEAIAAREAARWAYMATEGQQARERMEGEQQAEQPAPAIYRPSGRFGIPSGPIAPPPPNQAAAPSASQAERLAELVQQNQAGLSQLTGAYEQAADVYQQRVGERTELAQAPSPFPTNVFQAGGPGAQQLQRQFGAPIANLFATAENPVRVPGDVNRLLGEPTGGQIDPTAYDAWQQALVMAGQRLIEAGYDITDPEIQVALEKDAGRTFYDVMAGAQGLPTGRETIESEQDAIDRANREAEAAIPSPSEERAAAADVRAQTDRRAKNEIYSESGIAWKPSLGPLDLVHNIVVVDQTGDFHQAMNAVAQIMQSGEVNNIDEALTQAGVDDPTLRRLVKAIYG